MDEKSELFHYTSAGALLSIVTKRQLWASVAEFMNDKYEGNFVSEMIKNICENPELHGSEIVNQNPQVLRALRLSLNRSSLYQRSYVAVASFSQHKRSLPMYRMYTPLAGGFALSFPKEELESIGEVIEVNYCYNTARECAHEYITRYLQEAAKLDTLSKFGDQINAEILDSCDLAQKLVTANLKFKSNEFINEAEWRIIVADGKIDYRQSKDGNYLIPYRIVELPNRNFKVTLTYGPNREPLLARESMEYVIMAAKDAKTEWEFCLKSFGEYGYRP